MGYLAPFITGTDELCSTVGLLALQQLEMACLTTLTSLRYEVFTGRSNSRGSWCGDQAMGWKRPEFETLEGKQFKYSTQRSDRLWATQHTF